MRNLISGYFQTLSQNRILIHEQKSVEEIILGKVIVVRWRQKCNSFSTIGELLGNCSIAIHNSEKEGKMVQMLTNVLCVIKITKI